MRTLSKAELSVALLIATILISLAALFAQARRADDDAVDRAFASSEDLVDFVLVTQRQYTKSVANQPLDQLTAHPEQEPHKMWLPVTFAMRYTSRFSVENEGVDFKVYSRDPFPAQRDRVLDDFAEDALDALLPGGVPSYRRVEDLADGQRRVRLAVAFEVMEHCANCHNRSEWGLKRQDWQVGDVRGAWEVSMDVAPVRLHSQTEILSLMLLMTGACLMGFFVVLPSVRREVKSRAYFHDRSISMEDKARANLIDATTDALTGVGNRRLFDDVFAPMVQEQSRDGRQMAVILFDIDHFKSVNDQFGHDVGDQVLRTVADLIKSQIRDEDQIARFGGEEFVALIPDLSPDVAISVGSRVKDTIENHEFKAQ